ncbi:nitroreductase family protein [Pseudobacillus badius]|uniref:nitroreductase family protein n=1 Tax=Bacillus badius TaxID=1455 RepID=UPI0007B08194|nr:nitroreductase family protein [Bacillus badius]KZO00278.1 NAD(P)H nitroreductase [Bacillus badius]KZR59775.1 NAD(P)H nitroreductase [Bacillus badius]MED0668320.1 nitroreductase family protein [Bacillus badius]OCS86442.1 NAD(P)H nitroreductase [Bacillus badius]OVE52094.1 nitroreductase family protein [Bacillus badius]
METTMCSLSEVIRERKSVRKYDPNYIIPRHKIEEMLQEATLAPSSSNLQPWRFLVIDDQEMKKELRGIAYNQEQVETASAVIAVLGDTEMYKSAEKVYQSSYEAGFIDEESMKKVIQSTNNTYPNAPFEARANIASFDAGLVSMQLMLIAKANGYDTVTMGGFDKQKFAERFELSERYMPIVLIAVGKAAAPAYQTTRLPLEEVVRFI